MYEPTLSKLPKFGEQSSLEERVKEVPKLPLPLPSTEEKKKPFITKQELHTGVKPPPQASVNDDNGIDDEDLLTPEIITQQPYNIEVEEDSIMTGGKSFIHMWCMDRDSNPSLLRLQFPAFCYLQLPPMIDGCPVIWDNYSVDKVYSYLKFILEKNGHTPVGRKLVNKQSIHYYKEGDQLTPMMFIVFNSTAAMKACAKLVGKPKNIYGLGNVHLQIWEDRISIIRKMFTMRKTRYAQWFRIIGQEVPYGCSTRIATKGTDAKPIKEYICQWKSMEPISSEESEGWMTKPRLLSIDIETYSDNHHAMPNVLNPKHASYMISCVYQVTGDKSTREKTLIVLGDCKDIPGSKTIRCKTEYDTVKAMAEVIKEYDPEIITGYNIFCYDIPYLDTRTKILMNDWPTGMGRIQGRTPNVSTKTWNSGAYGHVSIADLVMEGRISVDMLPIIRRDYKLDKFTLDFVGNYFLKKGKHDVKAIEMFEIRERLMAATKALKLDEKKGTITPEVQDEYDKAKSEMGRVGAYCLEDSALVIDLFDKLNVWIGLVELSSIVGVTILELFTRGQQVRCLSQVYDLATNLNIVIDKRVAQKLFYAGGFVFEPKCGLYEFIICVDFASLYPSIMMAYNICYTTLIDRTKEQFIDDKNCNIIEFDQEEPLDGKPTHRGHVNDDGEGLISGVNDDPDLTDNDDEDEDNKSTITRHYKFKFVKREVRDGILPQLVRSLVGERGIVKKQIKGLNVKRALYLYVKDSLDKTSSLDETVDIIEKERIEDLVGIDNPKKAEVINKRFNSYMAELNKYTNHDEALKSVNDVINSNQLLLVIKDKRQLALKVSANSMYGFLGAQERGVLPLIEGAMSTTAWGRQLIMAVNSYVEDVRGGTVVYGDTDSSMVDLGVTRAEDTNIAGKQLEEEISGRPERILDDGTVIPAIEGLFPPPVRVEYEKGMKILCIKKKKYAYCEYSDDGSFKCDEKTKLPIINKKGISIARRDNCVTGDTLITKTDGTSIRIDSIDRINNSVYGWDGNGIYPSTQTNHYYVGEEKCLKLVLKNGNTLKCTPGHRVLVSNFNGVEWKEVQDLSIKYDNVLCSMKGVEDLKCDLEENWEVETYYGSFSYSDEKKRLQSLAYARVSGFIDATNTHKESSFPNYLDALAFSNDIGIITGTSPSIGPKKTYFVVKGGLDSTDGIIDILNTSDCPKSFIREYIAGYMGVSEYKLHREHDNLYERLGIKNIDDLNKLVGYRYNINCQMDQSVFKSWNLDHKNTSIPSILVGIESISDIGLQKVYDISVKRTESYIANGIVSHNCKSFKECYTKLLRHILDGSKLEVGFGGLVTDLCTLLNYEHKPQGNLTIIRGLGAAYKSASYFMKVFSDELRAMGKPANPGDRLEYVVVKTKAELRNEVVPLGKKMRSIDMWNETIDIYGENPIGVPLIGKKADPRYVYEPENIDVVYYLEHVYMNAIDQLFSIGYSNELAPIKETIGYQPTQSNRRFGSIEMPCHMISKIIHDYMASMDKNPEYTNHPDNERIKDIVKVLRTLPKWLDKARKNPITE